MKAKIAKKFIFFLFAIIFFFNSISSFEGDVGGGIGIDIKVVENAEIYENNSNQNTQENLTTITPQSSDDEDEKENRDKKRENKDDEKEILKLSVEDNIKSKEIILPIILQNNLPEEQTDYTLISGLFFLFLLLSIFLMLCSPRKSNDKKQFLDDNNV